MASRLFIVGAAKSGTYEYLKAHPDIYMLPVKEPHFFSNIKPLAKSRHILKPVHDPDTYEQLFADCGDAKYIGEASPSYLSEPGTAQRIYDYDPDARIIIMLREPINRVYSHYLMDVREGIQTAGFLEALQLDYALEDKGWGISHLYVELGQYCEQIRSYVELFGMEQILIVFFEEFVGNSQRCLVEVFNFLNVDSPLPETVDTETVHNPYASPRNGLNRILLGNASLRQLGSRLLPQSLRLFIRNNILLKQTEKPAIEPSAIDFLKPIYQSERDCLSQLIGRDLPWN